MSPDCSCSERHDATVDLRTDTVVPDVCVNGIGEINGSGARRQALDFAFGGEDIDLVMKEVYPQMTP